MDVDDLNHEAVNRIFRQITDVFNSNTGNIHTEDRRHFLSLIVDELNMLDHDDAFGTEGWKRAFGIED